MGGSKSTILPIVAGVAGGAATVYATSKLNWHPVAVAGAGTAAGLAIASTAKTPWIKQAGMGAAIGAATLGGVTLVGSLIQPKPALAQSPQSAGKKRGADGEREADGAEGFVTRTELNDALSKLADSHKEVQKQQTCDLLTALRDEIKKVIADGPNGPGLPSTETPVLPKPTPVPTYTYPFLSPRATNDQRSAEGDEYLRNAYGDDLRDAEVDDYQRNAYGEDLRDAMVYDERDASPYDERDASSDERDADGDQFAQMTGGTSM